MRPRSPACVMRTAGWCHRPPPAAGTKRIPATVEWRNNRGDLGSSSYSSLDQINRDNVAKLRIAWRWKSDNFGPVPEYYFRPTPLMADGILARPRHPRRNVDRVDATNGETLWMYRLDEGERGAVAPRRNSGRGVAYWRSSRHGEGSRIFTITPGFQLIALDALSGLRSRPSARRASSI